MVSVRVQDMVQGLTTIIIAPSHSYDSLDASTALGHKYLTLQVVALQCSDNGLDILKVAQHSLHDSVGTTPARGGMTAWRSAGLWISGR